MTRGSVALLLASVLLWQVAPARGEVADFDDLSLPTVPYWNGPAANATDEPDPYGGALPVKVGTFFSGNVAFGNEYNANYGSWSGFAYSRVADNSTPGFGNQYAAFPGTGNGPGPDNYGVGFGYNGNTSPATAADLADLPYFELPAHAVLQSAYVTNSTYAALAMRDGDSFSKQFGGSPGGSDPDWFKLSVYGVDASGALLPGSVEFYLADYRGDDDYIVSTWEYLDLSPLSSARRVFFNLSSSDTGEDGMNTPAFFAIDDIQFAIAPEPATWVLCLAGAALLAVRRRRTR